MDQENAVLAGIAASSGRTEPPTEPEFPVATKAFERFLAEVAVLVTAQLGLPIEIQHPSASQCSLKDALGGPAAGCIVALDLKPLPGFAYLSFGSALVNSTLEILLGARVAFAGQPRKYLTEVDMHVLDGFITSAVGELQKIWAPLTGATFQRALATDPPHDPIRSGRVVVLSATLRVNDRPDEVQLILPVLLARLAAQGEATAINESGSERDRLLEALASAAVDVQAVLRGSNIRFGDLVRLRTGMVLALPHKAGTPVECQVNGMAKFRGEMTRDGKGAAMSIQMLLSVSPESIPAPDD